MLGTGAVMANEVLVTCISAVAARRRDVTRSRSPIPLDAPGLKILSRKSYEAAARFASSTTRFRAASTRTTRCSTSTTSRCRGSGSSSTATLACARTQFHATPAHVYQNYQAQIRLMVKLRFLVGLARPHRRDERHRRLSAGPRGAGQLAAEAGMVEAMVHAAWRPRARMHGAYFVPDRAHALRRPGADASSSIRGSSRRCVSWPAAA